MNRICIGISLCIFVASSALAGVKAPKEKAPLEATVLVNCDAGDKIADALATPALNLIIEISGFCAEDFEINRTNLTLRGADPTVDGISPDPDGLKRQALTLRNVSIINIENLKLSGAFAGIGINDSFGVFLLNCHLENNEFAGAIVGTASGSVLFRDTVVSALNPIPQPNGSPARIRRGIWVTNGSSATCDNCTITEYRESLLVTNGGQLSVFGGSFTATRGALDMSNNASAFILNATLDGRIRMFNHSVAELDNTAQIITLSSRENEFRHGSSVIANNGTSLFGDVTIGEFSTLTLRNPSIVTGALDCQTGGDAFCDVPANVAESSNCGQCVK